MKKMILVSICVLLLCAGCPNPPTPKASLRTAVDAYATVLKTLAFYRNIGVIDDEAAEKIELARSLARSALYAWTAAMYNNEPGPEMEEAVARAKREYDAAFQKLITAQLEAERKMPK